MKTVLTEFENRIVVLVNEMYPVTVDELRDAMAVREDTLVRALNSLVVKGVVALEPLPDKTYVRLLVPIADGMRANAPRTEAKKRGEGRGEGRGDDDSIAYM